MSAPPSRHWKVMGVPPSALTENIALDPGQTLWFIGCWRIAGAVGLWTVIIPVPAPAATPPTRTRYTPPAVVANWISPLPVELHATRPVGGHIVVEYAASAGWNVAPVIPT